MQTAEQKKVHAFGWDSNMKKFGPNAQLGACVSNWGVYYTYLVQQVWRAHGTTRRCGGA